MWSHALIITGTWRQCTQLILQGSPGSQGAKDAVWERVAEEVTQAEALGKGTTSPLQGSEQED